LNHLFIYEGLQRREAESAPCGDIVAIAGFPGAFIGDTISDPMRLEALPPVVVNGEIKLQSELLIDDKGYRLRQAVGRNTTPYKFSVGSAADARLI
jgi:GTP-binding protein